MFELNVQGTLWRTGSLMLMTGESDEHWVAETSEAY